MVGTFTRYVEAMTATEVLQSLQSQSRTGAFVRNINGWPSMRYAQLINYKNSRSPLLKMLLNRQSLDGALSFKMSWVRVITLF
jgi:hypothetical protein